MTLEKTAEKDKMPNPLGLAAKVAAGWLALHAAELPAQGAEIPAGTSWSLGLSMMHEDVVTKRYEVGGIVTAQGKNYEWREWRRGEEVKSDKESPEVNHPFKNIAEALAALKGKNDYVCIMHTHTAPNIMGMHITSMPPSPGDVYSTVLATVSPFIPAQQIAKIKHGLMDRIGVWTYRIVEDQIALRARIKTQEDLRTYIAENPQKYNIAMQTGLRWISHVSDLERTTFGNLSDAEKVKSLRGSSMYKDIQDRYRYAGLIVRYATREEAAAAAPCDDKIGK